MAANVLAGGACHASAAAIVENPDLDREFPVRVQPRWRFRRRAYLVSIITVFVLSSLK